MKSTELLDPEEEDITMLRNVDNRSCLLGLLNFVDEDISNLRKACKYKVVQI
jgi:hypothetical protein